MWKAVSGGPPWVFLVALALAAGDCGVVSAAPLLGGQRQVFYDAAACRGAKVLSDGDCATAYANAKAEFDEKAPRFLSRAECERYFRRCMVGDVERGGRRVTFTPQMRGFAIEPGRKRQVVPVADGGDAAGLFQPRPVDRADVSVSAGKTAAAQQAWKSITAAPVAAAPSGDDAEAPAPAGPTQTYPLPPEMLQDLRRRERVFGASQDP
jgi:uncharacterized protein YgiB involved in biofilm formation